MKIAVMGGTFNPIHHGHLVSAEEVCDQIGFDKVLFIPSAQPPHKSPSDLVPAKHRDAMVNLAIQDNPRFEASRIEIDRGGPSYAIDTVQTLYAIYGKDTRISWIIGADMLIEFQIWKDFSELLDLCQFIATTRPRYDLGAVSPELLARVQLVEITDVGISSTEIRKRIRQNRSIRYLVPDRVLRYIQEHQLYVQQHTSFSVS